MVTKDGKPWFVFGVMGGDMQPQGQVQVLVQPDRLRHERAGGRRSPAHRARRLGDADRQGRPSGGGRVEAEIGMPRAVADELERRGHQVVLKRTNGGGYQGILIDPQTGVLHGGSEFRKDGCAAGY